VSATGQFASNPRCFGFVLVVDYRYPFCLYVYMGDVRLGPDHRVYWRGRGSRSLVVPKDSSLTRPACPSFSGVKSSNRGTILPLVAIAMSSISGPATHRTQKTAKPSVSSPHTAPSTPPTMSTHRASHSPSQSPESDPDASIELDFSSRASFFRTLSGHYGEC
jgi:hypothetical protein